MCMIFTTDLFKTKKNMNYPLEVRINIFCTELSDTYLYKYVKTLKTFAMRDIKLAVLMVPLIVTSIVIDVFLFFSLQNNIINVTKIYISI